MQTILIISAVIIGIVGIAFTAFRFGMEVVFDLLGAIIEGIADVLSDD